MHALVTHCAYTINAFKNFKNRSHGIIHTFKNYFATMFSVFRFQFSVSATISSIQTDPKSLRPCPFTLFTLSHFALFTTFGKELHFIKKFHFLLLFFVFCFFFNFFIIFYNIQMVVIFLIM